MTQDPATRLEPAAGRMAGHPSRAVSLRVSAMAYVALAGLYLTGAPAARFVDLDAWHQMALFREALTLGHLPRTDPFSYTSTVAPLVHHEWGMGAVLYMVGTRLGALGLGVLRDLLAMGIALACVLCALRRGASQPVLWATIPVAIVLLWVGVTAVRAQMFTLLFLSWLLLFLQLDREGKRGWLLPWLAMYTVWVNVHAGFVVGVFAFALHLAEQAVRKEPVRHLLGAAAAMAVLTVVNPYGVDYFPYLWEALRMERPRITEWRSILHASWYLVGTYALSLALGAYAALRGPRRVGGILFLLAAAYVAARHQRHLSIYGVAWVSTVPALLQATPFASILGRMLDPGRLRVAVAAALAAAVGAGSFAIRHEWRPTLPANPGEHSLLLYPVGAVEYLEGAGFRGNLVTPFGVGAYVMWRLYPDVLVSLDSRYEVAYEPELLDRHNAFFRAVEGWAGFLDELPTDAVLVRADARVARELPLLAGWSRVYRDDAFEVFVRDQARDGLPVADRRGERLSGSFP